MLRESTTSGIITEIEAKPIPHWFPPHRMMNVQDDSSPWGVKWRAGTSNFRTVAELFTKRNLWAIAPPPRCDWAGGHQMDTLLFALTAIILNTSRMYRYRESMKGGFQGGNLLHPTRASRFINVFRSYDDKVEDLIRTAPHLPEAGKVVISTQSACDLSAIPSNSVDFIFTDPPYSHTVQYGELNFVWEAWLGFDTDWHDEEIIVNDVRNKSEEDWAAMTKQAMAECFEC